MVPLYHLHLLLFSYSSSDLPLPSRDRAQNSRKLLRTLPSNNSHTPRVPPRCSRPPSSSILPSYPNVPIRTAVSHSATPSPPTPWGVAPRVGPASSSGDPCPRRRRCHPRKEVVTVRGRGSSQTAWPVCGRLRRLPDPPGRSTSRKDDLGYARANDTTGG